MALQAYTGVHVAVHVAVAYTCTAHVLWLSFELSRHFTELEQVGHYLIMTILGSIQERSLSLCGTRALVLCFRLKSVISKE